MIVVILLFLLLLNTDALSLDIKVLIKKAESVEIQNAGYIKKEEEKIFIKEPLKISAHEVNDKIEIFPKEHSFLILNGRMYRGHFLIKKNEGILYVLNVVDLEDYLLGVIKGEVSSAWNMETLKAQCIVARTFIVANLGKHKDWDMCADSVCCQAYIGKNAEDERIKEAVESTKGIILFWKDKPAHLVYHSCCGGRTNSAKDIWGVSIPYLISRACTFCKESPHFQWRISIPLEKIEERLKEKGIINSRILKIYTKKDYIVICTKNGCKPLKKHAFRMLFGPNIIRSARFSIKRDKESFEFYGNGWGHGVGMCQWGAKRMGELGYSCSQILEWYYPGTRMDKLE